MRVRFVEVCLAILMAMLLSACSGGGIGLGLGSLGPCFLGCEEAPPPGLGPTDVYTSAGAVRGMVEGDLMVFRGIRYAAPPVGEFRFKAPQPPDDILGTHIAAEFQSNCTQLGGSGTIGDEDCLFLNVWAHDDEVVRPVMVYLHPGSANGVGGDLASTLPDEFAVAADVVVVNVNRRLGVFGNLAIDELINENPRVTAGNYGVLDVIAALKWVKLNIKKFNGDPDRVMVFGTSAGGQLLCRLIATPEAAGLIDAVAIQSAPCNRLIIQGLTDQSPIDSIRVPAVIEHRDLLDPVGCESSGDVLACLRAVPAADLIQASITVEDSARFPVFAPIVDGVVVQADPQTGLENQMLGDIPLIIGMADNEVGNRFDNLVIEDDAAYRTLLANRYTDPLDDLIYAIYPTANYASPKDAYVEQFADVVFHCSAERLAFAASEGVSSYLYTISRGFDNGSFAGQGAVHAIDSPYLFGTFGVFGYTPDAQALAISDAMRAAWSSLARDQTGAPAISTDGTTLWPAYDPVAAAYVDFGETIAAQIAYRGGRCALVRAALDSN